MPGPTAHLFTSVRDSSSAQTLEAAALGVPTVTLALAGARDFLRRPGFVLVDPIQGSNSHVGSQRPSLRFFVGRWDAGAARV